MRNRRSNAKAFGLMAAAPVLAGAVVWTLRRTWTEHDVNDPGIT
jgi:hypothetical protein